MRTKRKCGSRIIGGLYLCSDGKALNCELKMPIQIPDVCPCCMEGIKRSRSIGFVSSELLNLPDLPDGGCGGNLCKTCPFGLKRESIFGLMWVDEKFYPTPESFLNEAKTLGVSKRIPFIPKNLKIGSTCVLLVHPKAIQNKPGVFMAFKPDRIEMPVNKNFTTKEMLDTFMERGIIPILCDVDAEGKAIHWFCH